METTNHEALVGRTIAGKYVIETFLGGGAMGAVFRAKQTALEKVVAIKVMHADLAKDATFAIRFHREAKAASRLDHPNSMRVVDFGEEPDGLLYIAMEYLEGRDLYKVIHEDWPLSEARIVDILSQALAALAVAHDMGVIHRDLKPENIMVIAGTNDEGQKVDVVKVCDFGIAKLVENESEGSAADARGDEKKPAPRSTTQGLVIGTPEYMSPEQAQGKKLDARSDLYSMGIILYQLLTGRVPFDGESAVTIVVKHVTQIPDPPRSVYAGVHPKLESVCLKAVEKSPEDRYSTARDMRAALRAALDGPPLSVSMIATTEPVLATPAALGLAATAAFVAPETSGLPSGTMKAAPLPASVVASTVAAPPTGGTVPISAVGDPIATTNAASVSPAPSMTKLVLGFGVAMVLAVGVAAFLAVKLELTGAKAAVPTPSIAPIPTPSAPQPSAQPSMVATTESPPSLVPIASASSGKPSKTDGPHGPARVAVGEVIAPSAAPTAPTAPAVPTPTVTTAPTPSTPTPPPATVAPAPAPMKCVASRLVTRPEGMSQNDLRNVPSASGFASCASAMTANAKVTVRVNFDDSGRRRGAPTASGAGSAAACFANAASGVSVSSHGDPGSSPALSMDIQVTCQ